MARRSVVAIALALGLLAGGTPAARAKADDLKVKRRNVQQQRAKVAATVDGLKASDVQVQRALDALEHNVAGQAADVASARQASTAATRRLATAKAEEEATGAHLRSLRSSLKSAAVDAYIHGRTESLAFALEAQTVEEAVRRQALFSAAVDQGIDSADELRATEEDLRVKRTIAEQAKLDAAARRADEEASLARLKKAEDDQQRVADQVEQRLDSALAEADALAAVDAQLAAQIAAREAAIAARVRNRAATASGRRGSRSTGVSVTSVRGIVVNVAIADQVERLLGAAEADGFALSGGGYRDPQQQVALRAAHCGSSDYDIYDKPPSACHPPTARPGSSMHEQGLAIDFTSGGRIISRSSPAYSWLRANASRFGLYNLPSEPWHWSTNGN